MLDTSISAEPMPTRLGPFSICSGSANIEVNTVITKFTCARDYTQTCILHSRFTHVHHAVEQVLRMPARAKQLITMHKVKDDISITVAHGIPCWYCGLATIKCTLHMCKFNQTVLCFLLFILPRSLAVL